MYTPDRYQHGSRHTETEYELLRRWGRTPLDVVATRSANDAGWFVGGMLVGIWFGVWVAA